MLPRHERTALRFAVLLAGLALLGGFLPAQSGPLRVIAMPRVDETEDAGFHHGSEIDENFLRAWRRLRDEALAAGVKTLVLEITTPGGESTTTWQVIEDIQDLQRAHGVRTVAFVPTNALSAGAMIALACKEIALAPGAQIGNATAIIRNPGTSEVRDASAKAKTSHLADLRRLALAGGFDENLVRAMADPDLELIVVRRAGEPAEILPREDFDRRYPRPDARIRTETIKRTGEALTLIGGDNLVGLPGFPHLVVHTRAELPKALGFGDRPLASEELLSMPRPESGFWKGIFRGTGWSAVLLVLGVLFLVLELLTPGIGLPGVLGILLLAGYFALNASGGPPVVLTMGLLLLGFFLLLVEITLLPGFGIAGIAGIGLILFSIYAATIGLPGSTFSERVFPDSEDDWLAVEQWGVRFLGVLVVGSSGALVASRHLHRLPFLGAAFLRAPILKPPSAPPTGDAAPGAVTSTGVVKLAVGSAGTAETDLRPAGKVRFAEGTVDVVSRGEWIERGTSVSVVQVEGNRVVVMARTA